MKLHLAALLLLPFLASAQTSGQSVIDKKNVGAGFTRESFTLSNGQLIGRTSAGALSGITLGTGLSLTGTTINASASGGAQDNYLLDTFTAETITTGQSGMGWDENGYFTIGSSAGWLQIYEAGDPLENTIHFAGRFTADAIEAASITGDITGPQVASGQIPGAVMEYSMPRPMLHWQNTASYAGANGLTYAATGPGGQTEPQTPAMYFAGIEVIDGDPNANYLQGRIRSASQVRSDLGLVISTNVMPWVAASTAGNVLTSNGTAWISSAPAAAGATLGANVFTDLQTVNKSGLGVTTVAGLHVNNPTAATNGAQQYSPVFKLSGQEYTTGGGSVTVNASIGVKTVQYTGTLPLGGGVANLGYFQLTTDVNGSIANVRTGYAGYNDLKLDLHGCLWLNPYVGTGLNIGGSPESGVPYLTLGTGSGIVMSKNQGVHWNDGFNSLGAWNLSLEFDAANVLAQRNAASAQTCRVYNTYTSSTNYERAAIEWASNLLRFGTQKGSGGGTAREMILMTDDTERARISSTGVTIASGMDLKLGNTAVAETPTATHTLIIKDAAGVSYRVLAVPVP